MQLSNGGPVIKFMNTRRLNRMPARCRKKWFAEKYKPTFVISQEFIDFYKARQYEFNVWWNYKPWIGDEKV